MVSAIVLAAGKGSRMKSDTAKQFMEINGKPLLYYSLKVFDASVVDEIILLYYDKTCKTMTDIKGGIPGYSWHEKFIQVDPSTIPGFPFKEDAGHGTNHNS